MLRLHASTSQRFAVVSGRFVQSRTELRLGEAVACHSRGDEKSRGSLRTRCVQSYFQCCPCRCRSISDPFRCRLSSGTIAKGKYSDDSAETSGGSGSTKNEETDKEPSKVN